MTEYSNVANIFAHHPEGKSWCYYSLRADIETEVSSSYVVHLDIYLVTCKMTSAAYLRLK